MNFIVFVEKGIYINVWQSKQAESTIIPKSNLISLKKYLFQKFWNYPRGTYVVESIFTEG